MATSPWYREGTAKFTEGSTTVTGTGTRWVDFVRAGDGIQGPDGKLYQVTNVASNTSMSITPAYGNETTYWTIPIQGYVKRLADAASQLVRDFEGGATEAIDAADRAKQSATEAKTSENNSLTEANRSKDEADRAELEADRAQQAADDAVAVVTGGDASIEPEAGKIPLAGASGTIKQAWVNDLEFALDKLRVATNKALYGDGPYPVLDFQFQGANMLDPRIEFNRASVDWDEYGNEYGIDEPVLTDKGLWSSGARTNLAPNGDIGSGWVTVGGVSIEPYNNTPPNRLSTPKKIIANEETATPPSVYPVPTISMEEGVSYVVSAFLNTSGLHSGSMASVRTHANTAGSYKGIYLTKDGDISPINLSGADKHGAVYFGSGWYRVWYSFVATGTSSYRNVIIGTYGVMASGEYIVSAGVQVEIGAAATPYIPTEGSQVTVADSINSTPLAEVDVKAIVADVSLPMGTVNFGRVLEVSDTTDTNGIIISTDGEGMVRVTVTNSGVIVRSSYARPDLNYFKIAVTFSGGQLQWALDGVAQPSIQAQPIFETLSLHLLQSRVGTFVNDGFIKSVSIYSTPLSDAQLQELTS